MENPPIGISQQQLVANHGTGSSNLYPGKKLPQYVAALSATLGALATGTLLGWSSPAGPKITEEAAYDFAVTVNEMSWVGSLTNLGAACICIPIGFIMDRFGRKNTMLMLVLPFIIGWVLIIWAVNLPMLMAGRFIVGLAGGAFCVTAPTYNSEIAQDDIRGTLGSFFQLMVTVGILYAYVIGSYTSVFLFSILCAIIPLIFGAVFFFMPETPYFLVYSGRIDEANKALVRLRGEEYDCYGELQQIEAKVNSSRANPQSFRESFSRPAAIKALMICYPLMFFQQFSGINAVLFNTQDIFTSAGASIAPEIATIIIGAMQVAATLLSTVVVDRLGRKILLLFSSVMMGICGVALGVYFYLKFLDEPDQELLDNLSWLPLVSLCIFIIAFSLGFGPVPWMMAGELCTPNIKAFVSSTAGTFNWLLAFIITTTFEDMKQGLGDGGAFWFFAGCTFLGAIFVFVLVPETKGKSLDEIQRMLGEKDIVPEKK